MLRLFWKHTSLRVAPGLIYMALLLATASTLCAQENTAANPAQPPDSSQPAMRDYRFEVASIRPGPPDGRLSGPPGPAYTPGHFREEATSIWGLAATAFGKKQAFEIEGPAWMYKTYFTVNATLPEGAAKADLPIMVQHLLEDRFALKVHHVTRQMAGYQLVVAKSGLKIAKSDGPVPDPTAVKGPGVSFKDGLPEFDKNLGNMMMCAHDYCALHGRNRAMRALAGDLAQRLHAPVTDATGLEGGYDYTVIFTDEFVYTPNGPEAVKDSADAPLEHPLLHQALKEQLGLEVIPVKNVPIDVVVLDSANKQPTEN
jgi:uncharacterized protein (TIGR03435 family)